MSSFRPTLHPREVTFKIGDTLIKGIVTYMLLDEPEPIQPQSEPQSYPIVFKGAAEWIAANAMEEQA